MAIEESADLEHLLVVDDDPEIRELTQEYLQQQGFHVAAVASGEEMDAYLSEHDVDLLILDLMLPGEHGLSIAQRLKKRNELPIIIVSARRAGKVVVFGLRFPTSLPAASFKL